MYVLCIITRNVRLLNFPCFWTRFSVELPALSFNVLTNCCLVRGETLCFVNKLVYTAGCKASIVEDHSSE